MAGRSSLSALESDAESWEARPIGQDAQGAVGACSSVCVYVARLFCAYPRDIPTPDSALISNMVIAACMHWKNYTKVWQSLRTALKNNFFLRMAIVGRDRCHAPFSKRKAASTHLDVLDELRHPNFLESDGSFQGEEFRQPACAVVCDGTSTFLLCKRFLDGRGFEYFFFDPHGVNSFVKGFETAEECAEFLRKACDLHSDSKKTWSWNWILCTKLPPSVYRELEENRRKTDSATKKKQKKLYSTVS